MHDFADDQRSILLLAGTGDGPRLAKLLQQQGWTVSVSVGFWMTSCKVPRDMYSDTM